MGRFRTKIIKGDKLKLGVYLAFAKESNQMICERDKNLSL